MVAQSEVIVACMKSISEELKFKRPNICRPDSVPSASFGFGTLASKPGHRYFLLAIAWDTMIQLVKFDDTTFEASLDGIYYCDKVIDYVQFTADSTLMAWSDLSPIKLIDTKRVKTGDYKQIESSSDPSNLFNPLLLELIDHSSLSEILQDSQCQITGVQSIRRQGPDGERVVSYANSIATFKRQIYFLCSGGSPITRLSIRSYQEYLSLISED